jgi:hypothetical protein
MESASKLILKTKVPRINKSQTLVKLEIRGVPADSFAQVSRADAEHGNSVFDGIQNAAFQNPGLTTVRSRCGRGVGLRPKFC